VLRDNLERVRQRIQHACQRSGRQPSTVTLIGVTKGVGPEAVREAVALGLTDLGENRVQEAREKHTVLGSTLNLEPVRWHLIGHLQRNKAKPAVELFDLIHSVDSIELIEEVERHAAKPVQGSRFKVEGKDTRMGVLVQVNVSGEMSKFGCRPEEALALCRLMTQQPHLHLRGLMTIAPFVADPEAARPHFRSLRLLRDAIASTLNLEPRTLNLSMGMSQDFEVAIEEGADFVRIGTALFGERTQAP
jgi:pyridoxal phosphate enzyme (YggS family)